MVELATHLLLLNYIFSVCGMGRREACMDVTLASCLYNTRDPKNTSVERDSLLLKKKLKL